MEKVIIVLPAYNEGRIIRRSVEKVVAFCDYNLREFDWTVIVSDNGSTDDTPEVGKELVKNNTRVIYNRVEQRGKGWGIISGWQAIQGDWYFFMDADLSTDLGALAVAITELKKGGDVIIGSRFLSKSKASRTRLRWLFSYAYRLIAFLLVRCPVKDLPCGFKAISHRAWQDVGSQIYSTDWFFDSELVILACYRGWVIKEIPVVWQDIREKNDKSKVKVISLGWRYFCNLISLKKRLKK